jgi:peptidoglycan/xylan/chitin deacetylase (PgdA/CDA1 family)
MLPLQPLRGLPNRGNGLLPTDSARAVVLTYHAIDRGRPPLSVEPALFRRQLDCIVDCGASSLTISELAERASTGTIPERAVAITFDDGFASVILEAAPMLLERGLVATVFCVAGYLGRSNDWPTQPKAAVGARLATGAELAELVQVGFEVGGHGMEHAPLHHGADPFLQKEIVESKRRLEEAIGRDVRSFAYPYGVQPGARARRLVESTYEAACTTAIGRVDTTVDRFALPRVDAHYLRRPQVLRLVVSGRLDWYLAVRRRGAALRRFARTDYEES